MSFLFPSFLWALFALSIPVIIHLFYFRRYRTVYFTNVSFLKELKEEKSTRNRLKHLLVLLLRLLLIACLVIAFAQPFLKGKNNADSGRQTVSIYLDNSFSMMAQDDEMPLLEKSRQLATEIVKAYPAGTQFHYITNDMEGIHQRLTSADDVINFIDNTTTSPAFTPLQQIVNKQADMLGRVASKDVYLISDFQMSMEAFEADSSLHLQLLPLTAIQDENVWIDSAWLTTPVLLSNMECKIIVKLKRQTNNAAIPAVKVSLQVNKQNKAMTEADFGNSNECTDTLRFITTNSGWCDAQLSIEDHPVTYDDHYYMSFPVLNTLKVSCIQSNGSSKYIDAFYSNEPLFDYHMQDAGQLQYEDLADSKLIILCGIQQLSTGLLDEVKSYLQQGTNVLVIPAANADIVSYNSFFGGLAVNSIMPSVQKEKQVLRVDVKDELWKDVFAKFPQNIALPKVQLSYPVQQAVQTNRLDIMNFADGAAFLSRYKYSSGYVFVFTTPIDKAYTDLPQHGLFAPLLYRMAITAAVQNDYAYTLSDNAQLQISGTGNTETPYVLKGEGIEVIPAQRMIGRKCLLNIASGVKQEGFYTLSRSGDSTVHHVALNYPRSESVLSYFSKEELIKMAGNENALLQPDVNQLTQTIADNTKGVFLWKYFVIAALFFLLCEVLVLRFWK